MADRHWLLGARVTVYSPYIGQKVYQSKPITSFSFVLFSRATWTRCEVFSAESDEKKWIKPAKLTSCRKTFYNIMASKDIIFLVELIIFTKLFPWTHAEENDTSLDGKGRSLSYKGSSKVRKVKVWHFVISVEKHLGLSLWLLDVIYVCVAILARLWRVVRGEICRVCLLTGECSLP